MSETLVIEAPAKLNLSLRVLRKREDGFHEINSLMVRVPGLFDRLTFVAAGADAFTCDDPGVPADASNLVLKALAAYRKQTGIAARLVVVGMVSNGFTIADKDDAGMLDVVGFDTATPSLISAFARGDV